MEPAEVEEARTISHQAPRGASEVRRSRGVDESQLSLSLEGLRLPPDDLALPQREPAGRHQQVAGADAEIAAAGTSGTTPEQRVSDLIAALLDYNNLSKREGFEAFDVDEDSVVSMSDLEEAAKRLQLEADIDSLSRWFRMYNKAANGSMSEQEWNTALDASNPSKVLASRGISSLPLEEPALVQQVRGGGGDGGDRIGSSSGGGELYGLGGGSDGKACMGADGFSEMWEGPPTEEGEKASSAGAGVVAGAGVGAAASASSDTQLQQGAPVGGRESGEDDYVPERMATEDRSWGEHAGAVGVEARGTSSAGAGVEVSDFDSISMQLENEAGGGNSGPEPNDGALVSEPWPGGNVRGDAWDAEADIGHAYNPGVADAPSITATTTDAAAAAAAAEDPGLDTASARYQGVADAPDAIEETGARQDSKEGVGVGEGSSGGWMRQDEDAASDGYCAVETHVFQEGKAGDDSLAAAQLELVDMGPAMVVSAEVSAGVVAGQEEVEAEPDEKNEEDGLVKMAARDVFVQEDDAEMVGRMGKSAESGQNGVGAGTAQKDEGGGEGGAKGDDAKHHHHMSYEFLESEVKE